MSAAFAAGLDRLIHAHDAARRDNGLFDRHAMGQRLRWPERSDTFQAGVYGGYSQGPVYATPSRLRLQHQPDVAEHPHSPVCSSAPRRAAPAPTSSTAGRDRLSLRSRRPRRGVRDAVRATAGYTGSQNAFTETGAQSLNLTVAQQGTNSLRSVIGCADRRRPGPGWREKLAMQVRAGLEPRVCRHQPAGDGDLRRRAGHAVHDLRRRPQRDGVVLALPQTTGNRRGNGRSISATKATSRDRTARTPSPAAYE